MAPALLDLAGRAAEREIIVPFVDLAALPSAMARPFVVAIAHLPILVIAIFAWPLWLISFVRPATHNDAAFRLLKELRTWSCDVVRDTNRNQTR
ncbi:hypothetical protein [Actinoplanes solisilvae]|uniref:hypothetical protein n=1 Tax=Actinoplanes solisilvae TaxID=2486853 RepID=UPI001F0BE427|nr:hypothetical protein [Actinoplanes solisilvae]